MDIEWFMVEVMMSVPVATACLVWIWIIDYSISMYSRHAHYFVGLSNFTVTMMVFRKLKILELIWNESESGGIARQCV